jgi:hypothetical protein
VTFTVDAVVADDVPAGLTITNTAYFSHAAATGQAQTAFTVAEAGSARPTVCLYQSDGTTGIPGAMIQYQTRGWKNFGVTGVDGCVERNIPLQTYKFRLRYGGVSQIISQDIRLNPVVIFQTTRVTVELRDSAGGFLDTGIVEYQAGGWKPFGTTAGGQVSRELLPASYKFRLSYGGISKSITQDVDLNPLVVFQAEPEVVVALKDSQGIGLAGGVVQYNPAGRWKTFGVTDENGEVRKVLPPGNYEFRLSYGGGSSTISQDIGLNRLVIFQTTRVTVELKDSGGNFLDTGIAEYHTGSWKPFGTTSGGQVSRELLPASYRFRLNYGGVYSYIDQDVSLNPVVTFQTTKVTVKLQDRDGNPVDPGTVQYQAGGWKPFGTTAGGQVSRELLPTSYKFRLSYRGDAKSISQDVSANPVVLFFINKRNKVETVNTASTDLDDTIHTIFLPVVVK